MGKVLDGLKKMGKYRVLLVSDHRTPVEIKTHSDEDVPFALYPAIENVSGANSFSEKILDATDLKVDKGYKLIDLLLKE